MDALMHEFIQLSPIQGSMSLKRVTVRRPTRAPGEHSGSFSGAAPKIVAATGRDGIDRARPGPSLPVSQLGPAVVCVLPQPRLTIEANLGRFLSIPIFLSVTSRQLPTGSAAKVDREGELVFEKQNTELSRNLTGPGHGSSEPMTRSYAEARGGKTRTVW